MIGRNSAVSLASPPKPPSRFRPATNSITWPISKASWCSTLTAISTTGTTFGRMRRSQRRCRTSTDMGFIRALIDRVKAEHAINPKRVYAFGYSNGGHMAFRLAIEAPEEAAAIAAIGAGLPTRTLHPAPNWVKHPAPCWLMGPAI